MTGYVCCRQVTPLLDPIQGLGLKVNLEKSSLHPAQTATSLDTSLDSRTSIIVLTPERQAELFACLGKFQPHVRVTWGQCLPLFGLMASKVQVEPLALLHMRPVQRSLLGFGLSGHSPSRTMVLIPRTIILGLR